MAAWLGAVPAVLVGGIGTLLIVLIWSGCFRRSCHVDSFDGKRRD